jgi:hypothetical protein
VGVGQPDAADRQPVPARQNLERPVLRRRCGLIAMFSIVTSGAWTVSQRSRRVASTSRPRVVAQQHPPVGLHRERPGAVPGDLDERLAVDEDLLRPGAPRVQQIRRP